VRLVRGDKRLQLGFRLGCLIAAIAASTTNGCAANDRPSLKSAVDAAVQPVIAKYNVAGMAVGVTIAGKRYVFNYGVASRQSAQPVTDKTLFELGSISKTFTATLAAYAQLRGNLTLSDPVSKYLPGLRGSAFGQVSLLNLGTHTPGGLPLQVPDGVHNMDQLMQYFDAWQPTYAPGTYRTYANPSIGLLGFITAKSMNQDFTVLMEQRVFAPLGMNNSFINIPAGAMQNYAQGYTKDETPIRMAAGVLSDEAYGIKATAGDLLKFIDANMGEIPIEPQLQRAITATHSGYFTAGPLTQDLIWEQYSYPVSLKTLLDGNAPEIIFGATPATEIHPPLPPQDNAWINKTGSTNGFGAYVAFVPYRKIGVVILANKNFPIDQRVTAAYKILTSIGD